CLQWNGTATKDEIQVNAVRVTYYCRPIPFLADKTVIKEYEDRMVRAATTASSLESEHDSVLVNVARHKLTIVALVSTVRLNLMLSVQVNAATAKVKPVNGERQIQALVDKKNVIITETIIRSDLKLEDAEGIDCLPTATIFAELERMGVKTIAWNEFSSTMASAIICL
ncbi:hypothetical protein Tco_0510534, partial [Tanacetum coccineum]